MRNYTTQMDAARKGIVTPEMKAVAAKEYRTEEEIRDLVAKGRVAICANKKHTCIPPVHGRQSSCIANSVPSSTTKH
jgi:phosphomethylpyrimidine synthase